MIEEEDCGSFIILFPPVGVYLSMEMKDLDGCFPSLERNNKIYPAFNYRSSYYANVAPCCMHNRNLI